MSKNVKKEILASEYSSEQVLAVNTSTYCILRQQYFVTKTAISKKSSRKLKYQKNNYVDKLDTFSMTQLLAQTNYRTFYRVFLYAQGQ